MDKGLLDSFFENFNGEVEKNRVKYSQKDSELNSLSEMFAEGLEKKLSRSLIKPRRFQNPYLYYRIDIKSITSVHSVKEDILYLFPKILDQITIGESEQEAYIVYPFMYENLAGFDFEDLLLVRIVSAKNGTTAIELTFIENPSVITFGEREDGYEVCYLLEGELSMDLFFNLEGNKYAHNDIVFILEKSKSPFDSSIVLEQ